ncbi:MAG TPA: MATE family efflux transporter [Gemmatimonadales bacterium]
MSEPTDAVAPVAPPHTIWSTIREAIRGSSQDFTTGSIGRAVILLAIPMVVEMLMESVFAVVDMFFVSRLGPDSVAAVGLTESFLALVYAIAMGLAVAVTALVSRRIGEERPDDAAHAAGQALLLGMVIAAVLGTTGVLLAPRLLATMGATPAVIATGSGYTRVLLGGEVTVILLFLLNAAFRGAGDAAIAMRVLLVANTINIVLNPCFIFGLGPFPALGVTGAAVATTIGRGIGALVAFRALIAPGHRLRMVPRHFHLDLTVMRQLVKLAGSAIGQFLISTTSWIGLARLMAVFGSVALAGYTIGLRVVIFAIMPAWGLSNAAATMVGQNLGAGKPERAEAAVWKACLYNFVLLTILGVIFVVAAPTIAGVFGHDAAMQVVAVRCLRYIAAGFPLYALGMVVAQAFNGAGDTWTPTWLNFVVFWCWEVPLAWLLAVPLGMGPNGVFLAIAIGFSTMAVAAGLLFRRGKWKLRTV